MRRQQAGIAGAARRLPRTPGAAGLRAMTEIARERRTPRAGHERDDAMVERRELRTMADAENGRVPELVQQALHQSLLAHQIKRRGGLVEHDDVRTQEEDARERQTLLLPTGQGPVPRRFLVEARSEMPEIDLMQGGGDLARVVPVVSVRVAHGPAQRAGRQVGPLRQHQ